MEKDGTNQTLSSTAASRPLYVGVRTACAYLDRGPAVHQPTAAPSISAISPAGSVVHEHRAGVVRQRPFRRVVETGEQYRDSIWYVVDFGQSAAATAIYCRARGDDMPRRSSGLNLCGRELGSDPRLPAALHASAGSSASGGRSVVPDAATYVLFAASGATSIG